jgi:hypothetical protein
MTDTDLEILAFFPADAAEVHGGKVFMMGGFWDQLRFPTYPAAVPASFVFVVNGPVERIVGGHKFRIRLFDEHDEPLGFNVEGEFGVGGIPGVDPEDRVNYPFAVSLMSTIQRAGSYRFHLSVDDGKADRSYHFKAITQGTVLLPDESNSGDGEGEAEEV